MNPKETLKKGYFEEVSLLLRSILSLWMLMWDFKEIILASEKIKKEPNVVRKCMQFGKWAQKYGLIDIYSFNPKFTLRG